MQSRVGRSWKGYTSQTRWRGLAGVPSLGFCAERVNAELGRNIMSVGALAVFLRICSQR